MSIRERVVDYIDSDEYTPLKKQELLAKFEIGPECKKDFYKVLHSLEKEGLIYITEDGEYISTDSEDVIVGTLQGNEKGFCFLIPDDKEKDDVFIPAEFTNGGMHSDRVVVSIVSSNSKDRRAEGEVLKVIERNNKTLVGVFEENKKYGFVIPDNRKIYYDIFIPKSSSLKAKNDQKVVVEITKWPSFGKNPEGRVIEILGFLGEKGTDILSIIREYDLPEEFPEDVVEYAKTVEDKVSKEEMEGRVDFRDKVVFTIDGADAKDLDDAISIEKLDNGNFELGVHIADVAHYVKDKSVLDKEAYTRGNSVYLIDRVIPMLPPELSNGICSLNEGVDRLTLSVVMEINNNGDVVKHKICNGVINSDKRLVYDHVSEYIDSNYEKIDDSIKDLEEEIKLMEELQNILQKKRENRGSINFDIPETQITLDKDGFPIYVGKAERGIANKMIEEFMLITNETVAEEYFWAEIPFLYRIHEEPASDKIATFAEFVHNLGYRLKGKDIHPKELQMLTRQIAGKKEESVINTLLLRSLKKAKYSEQAEMHFGLASQHYSHFTAPIRRYSDLVIHRIIKENIAGKLSLNKQEKLEAILPDTADHVSMTERRAEDAERDVEDMKKAEYMSGKIGDIYMGIVSSLTNFGMFIQLDNTIEGLVHFNDMRDDYYHFNEENYVIEGERSKKSYRLGDKVKVEVANVDVVKRTIDFVIADDEEWHNE